MVLATGIHEAVKQSLSAKKSEEVTAISIFGMSIGVLVKMLDMALVILALYYYFKCNWAKKSSVSDKILGGLAAVCCNVCYIAYHLAVAC